MSQRLALPVLALLTATTAFGAGLAWMTHMHHRALQYLDPTRMTAFDDGYELLSDFTVIPVGVLGVVLSAVLLWLRPRGVPIWLILTTLGLQLSIFITRIWLWGAWAEEVRASGAVRVAGGALHPAYERYLDTNGIRIAIIACYALLALAMTILAARAATGPRSESPVAVRDSAPSPG
ncbi:hypothetical protein ACFWPX_27690 [Nocardia sp. NPDC058518]|uniref:hypothetical protein n=1 Tax=Nocardia sp. NPDC058518 TaxID=3346534 RepID=UPI00364C9258